MVHRDLGGAMIEFTVYGTPAPQGSKRHVGRGRMIESSRRLEPWRQQVSGTALVTIADYINSDPLRVTPFPPMPHFKAHVPVEITMNFYFNRPKSAKRRAMTVKPDGDKLVRAIFDAIKGIVIYDDSQIVEFHARKHYGGPDRVEVRIQEAI